MFREKIRGKPVRPGLIIAGTDPVAVDATAARIMGMEARDVDHIRIAWELGLGEIETDKIEIRGLPVNQAKHPFDPARPGCGAIIDRLGIKGIRTFGWNPGLAGSECSGCFDTVSGALWAFRGDVAHIEKPLDILIGPREFPEEAGSNVLLYGDCQVRNRKKGVWVRGCPPPQYKAYYAIAKMTLSGPDFKRTLLTELLKSS